MKKIAITLILGLALFLILLKFTTFIPEVLGLKEKAGIKITSTPEADVFLNSDLVGQTPYQSENLEAKNIKVKIQKGEFSWEGGVKLTGHTLSSINRDLAKKATLGAGEVLTLEKGEGVVVTSFPSAATFEVDGESLGQTPGSFQVSPGEHTFVIKHEGFLQRSIRASVPEGYKLKISVDLAVSEAEVPEASTPPTTAKTVKVLDTPTGFLRVRDKPSTSGKEIGRVSPGDELTLLEELSGWDKVKLPDSLEGYVSAQYVSKK